MTKEERDALIASARKTPWLDTMKRRETEALLEALDDAEKRVRDIEDLRARIVSAMSCEPDDDFDVSRHVPRRESPLLSIAGVLSTVPIARSTLYRHISRGDLTPIRVGRRVFVRRADLARWLGIPETDLANAR